jgi:type I restriction enzyme, S subunit
MANWDSKKIKEIVLSTRPVTYGIVQPGTDISPEGIPLIRGKDYSAGKVSLEGLYHVKLEIDRPYKRSKVKAKDILFSIAGYVGLVAIVPEELEGANITQTTARISIDHNKYSYLYLSQYLRSHFTQIQVNQFAKGSAQQGLNLSSVEDIVIRFPDLLEQTRIAEILSTADEAIANTEALVTKYQRIKTGLMQDLLTKGIDEHGNIRSKATHKFIVKNGIEVPEEWEVDFLSKIISAVDPQPDHRTPAPVENGIPYLGINDIDALGNIDYRKCRKVSRKILAEHKRRYTLRNGDIIFGKIGTIGEPKRLFDLDEVTISANVILIQPKEDPAYLFWLLNSDFINRQVKNSIHSTSQPAFGMEKIRSLVVPIPKPDEQERISKLLNQAHENILSYEVSLSKLQLLKTGLMQDLLSGKVRVKV